MVDQMQDAMEYQLEIAGEAAALYVYGSLGEESVEILLAVCASLPPFIRTLRLDLRGIGVMNAEATNAVRRLLAQWRDTRRGDFRLNTSYMVATCSQSVETAPAVTVSNSLRIASDAMSAAYL